MNNPDRYPVEVFWSDEDEGFIATAPDLPGCSAFGDSQAEALAELDHAIAAWKQAAEVAGNAIPAPSKPAQVQYSGKFVVRMPKSMHAQLAVKAHREGVSLNQLVVALLASANGRIDGASLAASASSSMFIYGQCPQLGVSVSNYHMASIRSERGGIQGSLLVDSIEKLTSGTDIIVPVLPGRPRTVPFSPMLVEEK